MYVQPVGVVRSPVSEGIDTDWGAVVSELIMDKELSSGLKGLDQFSYIVVIFLMHRSTWNADSDLIRRPQGRNDMPLVGIFAQRAKHRPNPIGITAVRLLSVQDNVVKVQGLDAIDGTPVLDIKPYFPQFDSRPDALIPAWVETLMEGYF